MNTIFELQKHKTTVSKEIYCGITTFLTISYVLFINPELLSEAGMHFHTVYISTILASAITTLIIAFYANTPYAAAPGMGINSLFTYTICLGLQFHWKEALAVIFISGIIHIFIAVTPLRNKIVMAIPQGLKYASSVGIGLFIAYVGIKNAGLLNFTIKPGQYFITDSGMIQATSSAVPKLATYFDSNILIVLIGLTVSLSVLALERKTGESYGGLLIGIIAAAFVGIPLNITNLNEVTLFDFSAIFNIKDGLFQFFGDPGLISLFTTPTKASMSLLLIAIVTLTSMVDSISTIVGIGQMKEIQLEEETENGAKKRSRMDKTLIGNSFGGVVASLTGASTTTAFIESVTGIVAGGRTGLTSCVVGLLFLLCIPFTGFISMVPSAAAAPALIISGLYLFSLVRYIRWYRIEEAFPAAMTILFVPLTYSVIDGIAIGYLTYILMQCILGNGKKYILFYTSYLAYIFSSLS